jgi:hypothetical protein
MVWMIHMHIKFDIDSIFFVVLITHQIILFMTCYALGCTHSFPIGFWLVSVDTSCFWNNS